MQDRATIPSATIEAITGNETLLFLVPSPGDESTACGGLIAASCRRGRQPFVMVLGDGTASPPHASHSPDQLARLHERETRLAVRRLGLNNDRMLLAGLHDGQIPEAGPVFDAIVRAVTLVMWARDCNVICAPCPGPGSTAGDVATHRVAARVAATSEVGLLLWADAASPPRDDGLRRSVLDITPQLAAKRDAIEAHTQRPGTMVPRDAKPHLPSYEVYLSRA